ncbi:hypothetical protein ACRRTK_013599 [Alexandromys fortis]
MRRDSLNTLLLESDLLGSDVSWLFQFCDQVSRIHLVNTPVIFSIRGPQFHCCICNQCSSTPAANFDRLSVTAIARIAINAHGEPGEENTQETPQMKKSFSEKVSLYRGDITLLEVDAIVNADQRVSVMMYHAGLPFMKSLAPLMGIQHEWLTQPRFSMVSRTNQGLRAAGGEAKRAPSLSTFEPVEWLRERGASSWSQGHLETSKPKLTAGKYISQSDYNDRSLNTFNFVGIQRPSAHGIHLFRGRN